jgi:hypothetical protein
MEIQETHAECWWRYFLKSGHLEERREDGITINCLSETEDCGELDWMAQDLT